MSSKEWVYGIHTVGELLRQHPEDVLELLIQQDREDKRINELKGLADAAGVSWQGLDRKDLDKRLRNLQSGAVHQGVIATTSPTGCRSVTILADTKGDGITSP